MSKGFGGSDFAQLQTENATQQSIERLLEQDREQAAHARDLRAKGAYGICEDCGNQIGAERLEALPEATRCIGCQSAWESGGRSS